MLLFGTLGKCYIFKISFYGNMYLMEYHFMGYFMLQD